MPGPATTLLRRLLPSSLAWRLTLGTTIRRFLDGLGTSPGSARDYIDDVYGDLIPETTRALTEWEAQFGLFPGGSESSRRALLRASWLANGGQSSRYIQDVLRAAGFDVYVHESWIAPNVARDPRPHTVHPTIGTTQCGEPLAQCGEVWAQCDAFLANDPRYVVTETLSLAPPPVVPDDPATWPFFLYVAGAELPDPAFIGEDQRAAFMELLLKIRPAHLWVVLVVSWVGLDALVVDGDEPLLVDGDEPLLIGV